MTKNSNSNIVDSIESIELHCDIIYWDFFRILLIIISKAHKKCRRLNPSVRLMNAVVTL